MHLVSFWSLSSQYPICLFVQGCFGGYARASRGGSKGLRTVCAVGADLNGHGRTRNHAYSSIFQQVVSVLEIMYGDQYIVPYCTCVCTHVTLKASRGGSTLLFWLKPCSVSSAFFNSSCLERRRKTSASTASRTPSRTTSCTS